MKLVSLAAALLVAGTASASTDVSVGPALGAGLVGVSAAYQAVPNVFVQGYLSPFGYLSADVCARMETSTVKPYIGVGAFATPDYPGTGMRVPLGLEVDSRSLQFAVEAALTSGYYHPIDFMAALRFHL